MSVADVAATTVIALCALAVSIDQARLTRRHFRHGVRPALELRAGFHRGGRAGLLLTNVGLGPAVVVATRVTSGDRSVDVPWDEAGSNQVRGLLKSGSRPRPSAVTFGPGSLLAQGYERFILYVDEFDPDTPEHAAFVALLRGGLRVRIDYESLYGPEKTWWGHPKPPRTLVWPHPKD